MKDRKIKKRKNLVAELRTDLEANFKAHLAELVVECLGTKGFQFQTEHDMHLFFKNRVTEVANEGIKTFMLDSTTPICAYKEPNFHQVGDEINTGFQFTSL